MRDIKNPVSFLGRFVLNFALAYSACLVVMLIAYLIGRWDTTMAFVGSFVFSALFGVARAAISKPGERWMKSPMST